MLHRQLRRKRIVEKRKKRRKRDRQGKGMTETHQTWRKDKSRSRARGRQVPGCRDLSRSELFLSHPLVPELQAPIKGTAVLCRWVSLWTAPSSFLNCNPFIWGRPSFRGIITSPQGTYEDLFLWAKMVVAWASSPWATEEGAESRIWL